MIGGRQLTFRPAQTACAAVNPEYAPGSTGPQTRTSSSPTTGMPPTLALATRRADVDEADSGDAGALPLTFTEQTGPQPKTSSPPTPGMPPARAWATRRADVDEADSAEAVALLWTLIEQTDCVATSELGDVGVIAVVLFVEIDRKSVLG